jgi:uncharacterized protein YjiS (DUF1127 family)
MPAILSRPAHRSVPGLWPRLSAAVRLYRSRRSLLALDPHLLQDIGLSREEALSEASRPLWDAPEGWRR